MNPIYVLLTALTVSVDSFVAGFSLSLKKRKSLILPLTVAAVTYAMCLLASFAGMWLQTFLREEVKYIGAAILFILGISALLQKNSDELEEVKFSQCFAIGVGVGTDGAAAAFSLTIQGMGDTLWLPILFAATHFAAVFLGQLSAQKAKPRRANVFSAVMFFALAAVKLAGL